MRVIDRLVRNYSERPSGVEIDCIVIHYTGNGTVPGAISWWDNPSSKASAHFLIDCDGTTYRTVPEKMRAWHAGESCFQGVEDVNDFSIGIELHSTGAEFPNRQIEALSELTVDLMHRFPGIRMDRIVGHSEVAVPKGRKLDPGPLFPWAGYRAKVRAKLGALGL